MPSDEYVMGVTPIIINEETSTDELFEHAVDAAKKYGYVEQGIE